MKLFDSFNSQTFYGGLVFSLLGIAVLSVLIRVADTYFSPHDYYFLTIGCPSETVRGEDNSCHYLDGRVIARIDPSASQKIQDESRQASRSFCGEGKLLMYGAVLLLGILLLLIAAFIEHSNAIFWSSVAAGVVGGVGSLFQFGCYSLW